MKKSSLIFIPYEWHGNPKISNSYVRTDGSTPFGGTLNMNNNKIENVRDPVKNTDVANLKTVLDENTKCIKICERNVSNQSSEIQYLKTLLDKTNIKKDDYLFISGFNTIEKRKTLVFQNIHTNCTFINTDNVNYDGKSGNIVGSLKFNHQNLCHVQIWIAIRGESNSVTISTIKNGEVFGNKYFTYTKLDGVKLETVEFVEEFDEHSTLQIVLITHFPIVCKFFLKISSLNQK